MERQFRIVVLAKQVPDTRQVGKDAMTAEGTVNRAALPAIFNPEDLHALELALDLKSRIAGAEVRMLTMGPQRAAEVIREAMYRGADGGYLLSGREFAGSDTLATSYALACALKKVGADLVVAGRQAIDGDTAQVGPQVAEKLGWPQVTYAERVVAVEEDRLQIRRRLADGVEVVECPMPLVVTVNESAPVCRPRNAKRLMCYKSARTRSELGEEQQPWVVQRVAAMPELQLVELTAADIEPDPAQLGLSGSPTKVKRIENVVFQAKEAKRLTASDEELNALIVELMAAHTIG